MSDEFSWGDAYARWERLIGLSQPVCLFFLAIINSELVGRCQRRLSGGGPAVGDRAVRSGERAVLLAVTGGDRVWIGGTEAMPRRRAHGCGARATRRCRIPTGT